MNYGKENLSKRKKNISSKKKMKKKRVGVRVFKAVVICLLLIGMIGVAGTAFFAKKIIDNAPRLHLRISNRRDILPLYMPKTALSWNNLKNPVLTVSIKRSTRFRNIWQTLLSLSRTSVFMNIMG